MAARNFVGWRYTSDAGDVFVRRADSLLTAQQGDNAPLIAVGGSSAAGLAVYSEMPRNLVPRHVTGWAADLVTRSCVIYTKEALAAITVGTTTFQVLDAGGAAKVCTVHALHGEKPRGAIKA